MNHCRAVLSRLQNRLRRGGALDDGSAVVEFVTLGVLLLVPLIYLVVCLGQVQAAAFAAEGAAREAARVVTATPDAALADGRARTAVALALRDQGFGHVDAAAALSVACSADPCRTPRARVTTTVRVDVVLPGVPAFVDAVVPTRVPVSSQGLAVVDRFAG